MINKQDVLNNLAQVKAYINEIDSDVKEKKEIKIEIKNRFTGSVLFSSTKETYKEAVIEAVESNANLCGANLCGANLYGL